MRKLRNLLALLLVLTMLVSLFPVALAEDVEPTEEVVTEPAPEGEDEPTPPAEEPAEEPPEEPAEEPPEEPAEEPAEEEPAEEPSEEEEEEEEATELPFGFAGMPEGYAFLDYELAGKTAQRENAELETLAGMIPDLDYVADEVIVTAVSEEHARLIAEAYSAELLEFGGHIALLRLTTATVPEAVAAGMNPDFLLPPVDPNYISYLDPVELEESAPLPGDSAMGWLPERQDWQDWKSNYGSYADPLLSNPSADIYQYQHDMVHSYAAWGVNTGTSDVTVAVIDTGVDYNHPDLKGNGSKIIKGWDYVDGDGDPMDENSHGTHCAGIIAATMGNAEGGAGIAPNVSILAIRVLDENGSGSEYDVCEGIYYAADSGAQIISMSLGSVGYSYAKQAAVNYANDRWVTVIAAMGNNGTNIKCYPAACDGVIAVAAVNQTGERAVYSNYGAWCDVAAPGTHIWSTLLNGGYVPYDGTSMACPVVAGVAALYMSKNWNPGPQEMEKILKKATNPCKSSGCGKGIVDAAKLFDADKSAPIFWALDWNYNWKDNSIDSPKGTELSPDDLLSFGQWGLDQGKEFIYTLDGKTPTVKNGNITCGEYYGGLISLSQFRPGQTVTAKAISVSGIGVTSKVATWKIKIVPNTSDLVNNNLNLSILGPTELVAGKSVTMQASVTSPYSNYPDTAVTWSITYESGCPGAKINAKTGVLSSKGTDSGWIDVRATSVANPSRYDILSVYIYKQPLVSSMQLSMKTLELYRYSTFKLQPIDLLDSNKNWVNPAYETFKWTSSNTKVATVDKDGNVKALTKGSATITCQVQDGSGKKATCKVTVLQPATDVNASVSQAYVIPGGKVKCSATVYPADASIKGVTWSLQSAPAGVTINQKGEVTVPSYVSPYNSIEVKATSNDTWGSPYSCQTIEIISAKASSVHIDDYDYTISSPVAVKWNTKTWDLETVTLYSVDHPDLYGKENRIKLVATVDNGTRPSWKSSNEKIATVDDSGYVWAVGPGTATITATAQDGSGKKATCKIIVMNPTSYMTIKSKNAKFLSMDDTYMIGIGKSASNSVVFGDTFGKPTSTKVNWSFHVFDEEWEVQDGELKIVGQTDYTSVVEFNKWVTLSSSGTLAVNKKILPLWEYVVGQSDGTTSHNLVIYLTASSTDGTGVETDARFVVSRLTTKMWIRDKTMTLKCGSSNWTYAWATTGYWYESYTVTSSNPEVAGAVLTLNYSGNSDWFAEGVYIDIFAGQKAGTAKITIKANDGSGKSVSITVKVVK